MTRDHGERRRIPVGVIVAGLIPQVESALVVLALPSLSDDLGVSAHRRVWIVLTYSLMLGAGLIIAGRIADRRGPLRPLRTALVLFALAAALGGAAPNVWVLYAARLAQGAAGAVLGPATRALLLADESASDPGRAVGAFVRAGAIIVVLAPIVGGALISGVSWRAAFFVAGLLAVVALALLRGELPTGGQRSAVPTPPLGAVLLGVTIAGALFALGRAPAAGWVSRDVLGGLSVAAVAGTFLIRHETVSANPLIPMNLFRNRVFRLGLGVLTAMSFLLTGLAYLVSQFLQDGIDLSATQVGAFIAATGVGVALTARGASRAFAVLGARRPAAIGVSLATLGAVIISLGVRTESELVVVAGGFVVGCGGGFTRVMSVQSTIASLPAARRGQGAGIVHTLQSLSGSVGVAVLFSVVALVTTTDGELTLDARDPLASTLFFAAIVIAVISLAFVARLPARLSADESP